MAFVRNVAFPVVGDFLHLSGLTRRGIETREVKIFADGIANQVVDVMGDMHIGGVHKDVNKVLIKSQNRADEIIGDTPCIRIDLGDRMTLGNIPYIDGLRQFFIGQKHYPTGFMDLGKLEGYFYANTQSAEEGKIFSINGNHDMRMSEKVQPTKLQNLRQYVAEMGFEDVSQPVALGKGRIKLHGMPCYNTQPERYGSRIIRELIANINSHTGVNIVMVHNPDGVKHIESKKRSLGLSIDVPTLFICGHTHGLLGFPGIPVVGGKLSNGARKWIGMEKDTSYISGYYPALSGEPYGTFVSRGMGDQADIFRIGSGSRERPILRFVEEKEDAEIVLGG